MDFIITALRFCYNHRTNIWDWAPLIFTVISNIKLFAFGILHGLGNPPASGSNNPWTWSPTSETSNITASLDLRDYSRIAERAALVGLSAFSIYQICSGSTKRSAPVSTSSMYP